MTRRILACAFLLAAVIPARTQKPAEKAPPSPKVLYTIPLFVPAGVKTKVLLRGKNLDTVKTVTSDIEGMKVKFVAARKAAPPNNYPVERLGDSEVEVEVELPKEAKSLTVELKLGDDKISLAVASDVIPEKEPNDGFAQPQEIAVPSSVAGTIGRERDVDVFRITGRAGEKLRIEVDAAKLGSPLDALLTLRDAAGHILESADAGQSQDPAIEFTIPKDGSYLISVIDANDLGGPQFGYRLRVVRGK